MNLGFTCDAALRRHHSKSRDKRRSRSRSRDRRKKQRSRSGSRSKHHHHSRSRSKSRLVKKKKITATICIYDLSAHLLHIKFVHCNVLTCLLTGSERKRLRECAERVGAGLPVHLPSGAETQQWMRKRP